MAGPNPHPHPPVLVVAGPTASGKSDVGMALAERLDGVVINADAMQLYADLAVLTARPSVEDEAHAPHRLYGVLAGDRPASAGWWAETARTEIEAARAAGRRPILVGGSGLYILALMGGLSAIPPVPARVRDRLAAEAERDGLGALARRLAAADPESARTIRPTDRQRTLRALEVAEATGRPLSAWQREAALTAPSFAYELFVLTPADRAWLYERCDRRFDRMMEAGALDEVRALLARGYPPQLPIMKAHGVPELAAYLRGEIDLETAVSEAKKETRRYAKRQLTWWRHQRPDAGDHDGRVHGSHVLDAQDLESLLSVIFNKIKNPR